MTPLSHYIWCNDDLSTTPKKLLDGSGENDWYVAFLHNSMFLLVNKK